KIQTATTEFGKMSAVQTNAGDIVDDVFYCLRHLRNLVDRRLVQDAETENDASLLQGLVVANHRFQQFCIRAHDLFAGQAAQARRLDADIFDIALHVADRNVIADFKWLVESYRQRGKQIAEDVLQRQCNRNAADAETGDKG